VTPALAVCVIGSAVQEMKGVQIVGRRRRSANPPATFSGTQVIATSAAIVVTLGGVFGFVYLPQKSARAALEANVTATDRDEKLVSPG